MNLTILILTVLPVLGGGLLLGLKKEAGRRSLALAVFAVALAFAVAAGIKPPADTLMNFFGEYNLCLGLNGLSRLILVFVNLFGFLVALYSCDYIKESRGYYAYVLWLIAFSNLVLFSADFILFIFAWGAALGLLYALLKLGSGKSARKAFCVVGLADFSLILGISFYIAATGTTLMPEGGFAIALNSPLIWASFILMLAGALAKAGCGPFHTWIPDAAEDAPIPVMAILPASLDKLLGIYLLARICVDFFVLNNIALALLLIVGALTILFAVMMALIQHDLRKLLSYHAISQVGYMVLGFGTGVAIGIAGGIFHMFNHALYKTGLFLSAGAVGQKKKTFELSRLGGLGAYMPVTFVCAMVFSLSISGVPPFNGFASKWLLYQGAIEGLFAHSSPIMRLIYIFALIAAMFGSALTLASFVKFIHAVFLGQDNSEDKRAVSEAPWKMRVPLVVLAAFCVILGILPNLFLRRFIAPWIPQEIFSIGTWNGLAGFILLSLGLLLGWLAWSVLSPKNTRQDQPFVGGEEPIAGLSFPATEFYKTVEEASLLRRAYAVLKLEPLDLYCIMRGLLRSSAFLLFILVDRFLDLLTTLVGKTVLGLSWLLRKLHTGNLDQYLLWSLAGLAALFFILMGR